MKVLVVGGGGREHALCWKISRSELVREVVCAPGNAGTAQVARNVDIPIKDLDGLVRLALKERVDLVVIGPEDPLCAGLSDRLREEKLAVFGPSQAAARLEGSKVWSKEFLLKNRIPTAASRHFDRSGGAKSYVEGCTHWPQVIKADGLAGGKGVFVVHEPREGCAVIDTLMEERRLGDAGSEIIIEEFLEGEEVSILAITDGEALLILEPVMDHKQVGEGDSGPNTGGMGVYSPVPSLSKRVMRQIEQHILVPTLHGLRREEVSFRGVLFCGLMLTETGPRVLEYNCRFGDPEAQAIVRRLTSDIVPFLRATAEGKLGELEGPEWDPRACVGVVAACEGYPATYRMGDAIRGIADADAQEDVVVFHAGTERSGEEIVTDGGRVLCITALGDDIEAARLKAYDAYDRIHWDGKVCRRDIGAPRRKSHAGSEAASPSARRSERGGEL